MSNRTAPNLEKYRLAAEDPAMVERMLSGAVEVSSGCHEWIRGVSTRGYAITSHMHKTLSAHRLAYWVAKGAITGELVVDHICRNRKCINPDHLRLLTASENMAIAGPAMSNSCRKGHLFEGDNYYVQTDRHGVSRRICRLCRYAISERAMQKRYPNRVPRGPRSVLAKRAVAFDAGIGDDQLRQAALSAS